MFSMCKYDRCYKIFINKFCINESILIDKNVNVCETMIITIIPSILNTAFSINIIQTNLCSIQNKILYKVYIGNDVYTYWGYILCIDNNLIFDNYHIFDDSINCIELFILGNCTVPQCIEVNKKSDLELFTCSFLFLLFTCTNKNLDIVTIGDFCLFIQSLNNDIVCTNETYGDLDLDNFKIFACSINNSLIIEPISDFINIIINHINTYSYTGSQVQDWTKLSNCITTNKQTVDLDKFINKLLQVIQSTKSWITKWSNFIEYIENINLVGTDISGCLVTELEQTDFIIKMQNILIRMYNDDVLIDYVCTDPSFNIITNNAIIESGIPINIDKCTLILCCVLELSKIQFGCFMLDYALCTNYNNNSIQYTNELVIYLENVDIYDISGCTITNEDINIFIEKIVAIFSGPYANILITTLYLEQSNDFKQYMLSIFTDLTELNICNDILRCLINVCALETYNKYACALLSFINCAYTKVYVDASNNINTFSTLHDVLNFILFTKNVDISGCTISDLDYQHIQDTINKQIIEYDNINIESDTRTFTKLEFIVDPSNGTFKNDTIDTLFRLDNLSEPLIDCINLLNCLTNFCPLLLGKDNNKYIFANYIINTIYNYLLPSYLNPLFNASNQQYKIDIENQKNNVTNDVYDYDQLLIMYGQQTKDTILNFLTLILDCICYFQEPDVSGNINNNSDTAFAILLNKLSEGSIIQEMIDITRFGQGQVEFKVVDISGTVIVEKIGSKVSIMNGPTSYNYPSGSTVAVDPMAIKPYLIFNDDGLYPLISDLGINFSVKVFSQIGITFTDPNLLINNDFCDEYILSLYSNPVFINVSGTLNYCDSIGTIIVPDIDLPVLSSDVPIDFSNINLVDSIRIVYIRDVNNIIKFTFKNKINIYLHQNTFNTIGNWYNIRPNDMIVFTSLYETTTNNNIIINQTFYSDTSFTVPITAPNYGTNITCNHLRAISIATSTSLYDPALLTGYGFNTMVTDETETIQKVTTETTNIDTGTSTFTNYTLTLVSDPIISWNLIDFQAKPNNIIESVLRQNYSVSLEATDNIGHSVVSANDTFTSLALNIVDNGAPGVTSSFIAKTPILTKTSYYIDEGAPLLMNQIIIMYEHIVQVHTVGWNNTVISYDGIDAGPNILDLDWTTTISNTLPPEIPVPNIPIYPHASIYVLKGGSVNFETVDVLGNILISTDSDFNEIGNSIFAGQGIVPVTDPSGAYVVIPTIIKNIVFNNSGIFYFRSSIGKDNMTIIVRVLEIGSEVDLVFPVIS